MHPFAQFVALISAALWFRGTTVSEPAAVAVRPGASRVLVWAVDGLSYEAFTEAKRQGLFKRFSYTGRHVAPYPSMSHPSWTEISGAERLFGARGKLRSVEAAWFDTDAMRAADDPRQVFARQAGSFNYMRAFDWYFDPLSEPLMYFEGERMARRELDAAERNVLERFTGAHHVVFLGAADAIAHTHLNALHGYLRTLDARINRVTDSLAARGGTPVRQFIVSDHGNVGAFAEGAPERRLTPVSFDAVIRKAGLIRRDTGRLVRDNEVSIVTLALASMVNLSFANLDRRRDFARAALQHPAVDLVTWLDVRGDDRVVVIAGGARGDAQLRWRSDGALSYTPVTGNPLDIPDSLHSASDVRRWVRDEVMRAATQTGPYPDAPYRLVQSAMKQVESAPDLIVSLRDGFCWAGSLGRYVKMVRTHGALSARSTLGLLAATDTPVPAYVRSNEILAVTGITERALFHRVVSRIPGNAHATADSLLAAPRAIPTGRDDDSPDADFLRRVRPLILSAEYFDADILRAMGTAFAKDSASRTATQRKFTRTRTAVRQARPIEGIARHIDTLVALVDPLPETLDADSLSQLLDRAERRLGGIPELAPLAALRDLWLPRVSGTRRNAAGEAELARRTAMAAWTIPFFVDAALEVPETDAVADPRDRAFAARWHRGLRDSVRAAPAPLFSDSSLARTLFREVLAERELMRRTEGTTVPAVYDAPLPEVTVVYAPGIFGELFDDEIWRRALRSVREQLGVRVLSVSTDGRCSAPSNARLLLQALRDDIERRRLRGHTTPRYVIVGYSKGGVDAAEALVGDADFARRHVAALVTIASPHGGSPVAERADVPDNLLRMAVSAPRPASCDTTRAVESLWPANRAAFWSAAGAELASTVPLFSLSLVSDMRDAHPFMKITKRIARFTEENDGVVSVSASRFPRAVRAVHLGEVRGDHMAARGASAFPQESVLESVLLTLNELGVLEGGASERWRRAEVPASSGDISALGPRSTVVTPSRRPRQTLPGGLDAWTPTRTFRMNKVEALAEGTVVEATAGTLPSGIDMRCDHDDMSAFREEYRFLYDAGNGGGDNSTDNGFSVGPADTDSGRACRLHTQQAAMKMTTVAFRFAPTAFPQLSLRVRVDHAVQGVAPDKGGRGRNDASLKIWYVLRDDRPASRGRRLLFGYTWSARDAEGRAPAPDSLVEGGSSRRRIAFTVLPEAWLVNVGGPEHEGRWTTIRRDFARDVQRAYPGIPLAALRVIAITVQSDSDDSRGETDVWLDQLTMRPPGLPAPR
jgi:hypothetical protein